MSEGRPRKVSDLRGMIPPPGLLDSILREAMLALIGRGEVAALRALDDGRRASARIGAVTRWAEEEDHLRLARLVGVALDGILNDPKALAACQRKTDRRLKPYTVAGRILSDLSARGDVGADKPPKLETIKRHLDKLLIERGLA